SSDGQILEFDDSSISDRHRRHRYSAGRLARCKKEYGKVSVIGGLQIRHLLVALLAIPPLYLTFILYRTGNIWIALILLAVTCLGVFIYLSPSATTFRYIFPGLIGFALFVILPLVYTVYIGFTKFNSQNLLDFGR